MFTRTQIQIGPLHLVNLDLACSVNKFNQSSNSIMIGSWFHVQSHLETTRYGPSWMFRKGLFYFFVRAHNGIVMNPGTPSNHALEPGVCV